VECFGTLEDTVVDEGFRDGGLDWEEVRGEVNDGFAVGFAGVQVVGKGWVEMLIGEGDVCCVLRDRHYLVAGLRFGPSCFVLRVDLWGRKESGDAGAYMEEF